MAEAAATGEGVRVAVDGSVATITLDRPDALNALTISLKEALLLAIRRADRDPAVRAIVLTGAGRAFCAGQDLKERLEPDAPPLETELRERYNPLVLAMRESDTPIVGAINGIAAGAGASLALACDILVIAEGRRSDSPSAGSASSPTAARRGCCPGSSAPAAPPPSPSSTSRSARDRRSSSASP